MHLFHLQYLRQLPQVSYTLHISIFERGLGTCCSAIIATCPVRSKRMHTNAISDVQRCCSFKRKVYLSLIYALTTFAAAENAAAVTLPQFPPGAIWRQPVDTAALHPNSQAMLDRLTALGGFGNTRLRLLCALCRRQHAEGADRGDPR